MWRWRAFLVSFVVSPTVLLLECNSAELVAGGLYYKTDTSIAGFQSRVGCLFFLVGNSSVPSPAAVDFVFRVLLSHFLLLARFTILWKFDLFSFVNAQVLTTVLPHGFSPVSSSI